MTGDLTPAAALRAGWGLDGVLVLADAGVNNQVWCVTSGDVPMAWLRRCPAAQSAWRERELALLQALAEAEVQTPRVLTTRAGARQLRADDALWSLTAHVPGEAPSQEDPTLFPALAAGMASLHQELARLDVAPVAPRGVLEAFAGHRSAPAWVHEALAGVASQLERLRTAPSQLVHGDFSHPNLRVRDGAMTGVLDFEFASVEPVALDLATLALTLLVRTRPAEPGPLIDAILAAYLGAGGAGVDRALLRGAVVLRKVDSYWHHLDTHGHEALAARQLEQLDLVVAAIDRGDL
jgi:Ser/Thr protein kinase RdoA (MazF antagonist)